MVAVTFWVLFSVLILSLTPLVQEEGEFLYAFTNAQTAWTELKAHHEKEDDFLTIMFLNALTDDFPHVCNHIADAITTSTLSASYGLNNIHAQLDVEQQLIDSKKSKLGDVAMVLMHKGGGATCSMKTCPDWAFGQTCKTQEAMFVASGDTPPPSSQEFASLASDTFTPAFIQELSSIDDHEFTALLVAFDGLQTSLDWH
ncbi:hypothetical protein BDR04DRAFT_1112211 [Suillus decipiens]|nr:hypothetical protein BDR04DRAFT_1112211 [Suillus decipiens]